MDASELSKLLSAQDPEDPSGSEGEDEELRRFIEERLGKLEDLADVEEALEDPELARFIKEVLSHRDLPGISPDTGDTVPGTGAEGEDIGEEP